MNSAGITNRIYDFAVATCGWMQRRARPRQHRRLGDLRRHVRHRDRRRRRARHHRDQGDEGPRLRTEFAVGVTAASATIGPIIPPSLPIVIYGVMANVSIGALFLGGVIPGAVMALFMMLYVTYCARRYGMGRDQAFRWDVLGSDLRRGAAGADDAGHHHRRHDLRLVHADRSRDRRLHLGADPRHLPLSLAVAEAVLQGHDGHHRDDGRRAADRRRRLAVRLGADDDAR